MRSGQVSLTTMKLVLASHVAGPVVAVLGTVAKPLFEASVVRAGVIAVARVVVRVNGERLLAAFSHRNAEAGGGTLPVASWTGCKHRCNDVTSCCTVPCAIPFCQAEFRTSTEIQILNSFTVLSVYMCVKNVFNTYFYCFYSKKDNKYHN